MHCKRTILQHKCGLLYYIFRVKVTRHYIRKQAWNTNILARSFNWDGLFSYFNGIVCEFCEVLHVEFTQFNAEISITLKSVVLTLVKCTFCNCYKLLQIKKIHQNQPQYWGTHSSVNFEIWNPLNNKHIWQWSAFQDGPQRQFPSFIKKCWVESLTVASVCPWNDKLPAQEKTDWLIYILDCLFAILKTVSKTVWVFPWNLWQINSCFLILCCLSDSFVWENISR